MLGRNIEILLQLSRINCIFHNYLLHALPISSESEIVASVSHLSADYYSDFNLQVPKNCIQINNKNWRIYFAPYEMDFVIASRKIINAEVLPNVGLSREDR